MTPLLPQPDQLGHLLHRLLPLLQIGHHLPLPLVTLDVLTLTRALDRQPPLQRPRLAVRTRLDARGQHVLDLVETRHLEEVGLLAQADSGAAPSTRAWVLVGEEWVGWEGCGRRRGRG